MANDDSKIFKDSKRAFKKPEFIRGEDFDYANVNSAGEFINLDDLVGNDPEQFDENLLKEKLDYFNKVNLNVDYSSFESHSFFSNANELLQVAITKVLTEYPITASLSQIENFYNKLSGYEKFVFNNWPKVQKEIIYSPDGFAAAPSGSGVYSLNPKTGPWTTEFWIKPDSIRHWKTFETVTGSAPVIHKVKLPMSYASKGFGIYLSASTSVQSAGFNYDVIFQMLSGEGGPSGSLGTIKKDTYTHVAVTFDGGHKFKSYLDGELSTTVHSGGLYDGDKECVTNENLTICSGGQKTNLISIDPGGQIYGSAEGEALPQLSASLDNIRLWNVERNSTQINKYYNQNILSETGSLVAYWKMNNLFEMPDRT